MPVMTRPCAPWFLSFMKSSDGSRIITCGTNVLATPCKAPPWCTRLTCDWRNKARLRSRTANISLAICAQLMRQILVEYARSRNAAKRDGGYRLTLDDDLAFKTRSVDMVALDDALNELAKLDQQQSRIVELRFFGGLSIEETSRALNLSPTTVKRHWAMAKLWLHHQMSKQQTHDAGTLATDSGCAGEGAGAGAG